MTPPTPITITLAHDRAAKTIAASAYPVEQYDRTHRVAIGRLLDSMRADVVALLVAGNDVVLCVRDVEGA